ncbi:MAG: DUF4832 domain-containing protein [Paludibacteraceae bacterium]|nr:DUF4832 domain-containing protein [Paludibacteraceae bacterium]
MMKAFSFLTILESLSKNYPFCEPKCIVIIYESITSQLRVSRPFSHRASRRASHFAAILTILFTIGVGSVWGADYLINVESSNLSNDSKWYEVESVGGVTNKTGSTWSDADYECTPTGAKTGDKNFTIRTDKDNTTEIKVNVSSTSSRTISSVKTSTSLSSFSVATNCTPNGTVIKNTCDQVLTFTFNPAINAGTYVNIAVSGNLNVHAVTITTTSASTPEPDQPVTSVSLDKTSATLEIGETETLTATITPNTATNKNVSWTSSNTSVATVENGVVTAVAAGTATITVTTADGNKTATCAVTVNAAAGGGDGDCPESGEIFSWIPKTGLKDANIKAGTHDLPGDWLSSVNGGQAQMYVPSDGNMRIRGSQLAYNSSNSYIHVTLDCRLQVGDVILINSSGNTNDIYISTSTIRPSDENSAAAHITQGTGYVLQQNNTLVGLNEFYVWRISSTTQVGSLTITRSASSTPEPEAVPQVGTFTGMGMSGSVNLYWTMPTKPVTTTVDIASATLSEAVGQSTGATSTRTKENTNEIKVEYSTDGGWKATGVQIPLATPQTNVESITFEYKSASNQSVDFIPFLYDGTTRWVESGFAKLTPTEWTSHTSVIAKEVWNNSNIYSKDKTIESVNFYANPATATSGTFYIRNVVLNQGTQVAASGLIIVRKVDSNPTTPTDGTQVYDGNGIAATCTDNGLTDGTTYYYAAFAHDGQGNYSEPLYWQYTYTEGVNTYAPDDTDFPNPERGFYEQVQWNANKGYDAVIGDSYFDDARAANRSLILRIYYMDSNELRQNDQLPADFIAMFNADMEKFRTNGMKCILRFAYDENSKDGAHDASPAIWAAHLEDLAEHLQENADVIYVVQAGFLGVWGEWYYSKQGTGDRISEEIKNNLIDQLLDAVPANRCVQLRTPLFKKEYLDNEEPLTSAEAYKGTAQARLGHHNDAFLNGEENQGTYENRETDMAYIAQECMYVPIGGETNLEASQVNDLYDKYCKGTVAEAEMAQLHYSYLNHSYSTVVTNRWKAEGSYARMSKQLGYRFELESATLPNEATAGTLMNVQLNIKNVGYAPLYNERYAYIVFKNNTNTYSIKLSSDPRTWAPNKVTTTINENVTLPVDMQAGIYDMYLHLPDASDNIANNPKYAVRFANQGIWESETGYNKLNKQVVVTATDLDTYTITYNCDDATSGCPENTQATNLPNPLPSAPTKTGYTFVGWYADAEKTIQAVAGATLEENTTLYAKWNVNSYTLTWDVNGGNALTGDYTTGTVAYGTTITKPADPTREGYTFAGWSPAVAATMPATNTTYTAQWNEIKVASITVNPTTLDLKKGESATVTATVSPNNALNKTVTWVNPSITTLSSETGNSITVTGNSNGKDKELKASAGGKQATVKVSVYYEVQYNSNGGSACTAGKCYDSNGVTLPEPTKAGYTFAGWYENEALTQSAGAADATYKPSDNITLYAKWTVAKTDPTTTWTVAETVYAGQLVSVSVTTNSDATLTTGSLTTNKGTLVNATVNGQTITATLQVPGDASGTITLTLRTDATENYNASTSTKTITLSECPTTGSGGEETVTLAATDNQASGYFFVGDGSIITNIVGQGAKTVAISGKNDDKKSKITVDGSNKEATITFTIGTGVTITSFKAIGTANEKTQYDLDGTTVTIGTALTGLNKTSSMVFKLTCTDASGSSNRNTEISSFVLTYTSSGSGESTLETNLAWSTDLLAGVEKQIGNTFTYTASSNNSAGAITYSSSDENIAAVNQTTGEVTTKAAGTTTITATIAEIGCYPTKSITYTLTVTSTGEPTPEPGSYILTYDENKPSVWNDDFAVKNIPEEQTLTDGTGNVPTDTPNPPVITEDAGSNYAIYTFAGWNTAADGTGTSYAAGEAITITENTTLYAQWTPCTYDVKYFDQDKETPLEGMVNTTYTFGVGIPNLPTPTKPGHTFIRWHLFYDGEGGTIIEEPVVSLANDIWGVLQLAAQWTENCTMPTTTFANGRYVIGSGALDLRTLIIADKNSEGEITYAVTGGVAATINGSSFTCDRIGVVTVTATQAASGGYCEKIMTATINVAMPVTDGCAQMFTFKANDAINNPDGQKGQKYLDLSSYATINGLSTTGKVGIKDMETSDDESTTLIKNNEIYFPNTNTYLKVENLSTPLAAGDVITIDANQDNNEYIITLAGTQCKSNCITTDKQQYTIPAESSLIGVTTFYIWAKTEQTHLNTINICRPAYEITYMANNGTDEAESLDNAVLVAGCPNTFTVPAGKQFAGWNTAADGKGTSYSVGTIIPLNNLILYAQWKCIEPVFTVSCDKTAYAKGEDDAKPITVTVTAGNSGGVTYQWYASDKNDRTTGTKITGAIAASYTPSTATAGTTYYWCEISNSCTTVKTPTIAITVTVTKNNPVVTWSDPSDVNYGGGGYSISATVNDGWNGTLLPSMLTAPTGINLYDIEINGKTITAKFDVTTTFDRTAGDKIPFVLTLPETTTYNPKVSENKVFYDACATGGTKHRIPVKEKSVQQDINPYNRWDTENIGWITWDQGGGTISSESETYNNFSYRTKSGKQVILIYSKIQEVKTIRIYGYGSNATQCTAVSVGKEYNKYTKLSASEYAFNGNTINNRENGVIEISFTTPLKEGTYVQFNFSKNALFYGVELETEGGEKIETTLSFATAGPIEKQQNDANFTNKATPSNNTLGTITYSSSNTDVATVNSTTGEVSIIAAGTTTITATLAPSGCYQGATATYELTVTEETCAIAAGTLSASKTDKYNCEEVTLTLSNYEQGATIEWWHNGEAINSKPGITINGNTLTTTLEGTYSALVTKGCSVRSNSVTITNVASASATPLVNEWYIKSGRLTPPIALWKLEGGARKAGVVWIRGEEVSNDAPYDNLETAIYEENGIVYLTGTPPQANETGEDIKYTIQLSIYNSCDDTPMVVPSTITIVHQKNTDKHVLAFVVTGKEKGGFTEGITTAQTTNVPLYNEISQEFDVLATNIYATDNEQLLKEYYSRFDIICITDYPNTKEKGVNGKSYTDAMGALIDIRPIFSMEAWVSNLPNWNDKGVKGEPVSPTTRQYSMLLQCKDHEIFAGTTLITEGSGDEEMYRVTMVDATKEDYVNLDKVEENPHQEKEGYKYGSNPALQGFRYESSLSSMLPIGTIEDGAGKIIQVGLERQQEEEARMMVVGVNSYAMERLTDDGETVIINTLKYLMKKSAEDISDCSIFFDNKAGDNQWNNPANWGPSYNSVPLSYQGARILEPCIVSDVVAKAAKVKIATSGTYDKGTKTANGSLTIAPNGALVVGGVISEVTAPNYYEIRPTQAENLIVKAEDEADSQHRLGALIHNNENGETSATIQMWNPSHWKIEGTKKKKYWSYVAVPIQEAPIPEFFYHGFTYLYDETQGWIKKGDGTVLYPFQGIGASLQTGNMETFYGKLATTDDQDIILTKTTGVGEGQNLIGNSWTAPIQIANFEEEDFNDATATVYVYNTGRDEQASGAIGTPSYGESNSTQAGQWISVPVNTAKENAYTGLKVIPAMNAFQVNTPQETELHLNYNRLVRGEGKGGVNSESNLNQPMRAPHKPIEALMRIRVAGEKTHTDMWLLQDERFDYGFDNGWEAEFVEGDDRSAQLYAVSEIGKMAFLAQPELDGTLLGFAPSRDGAEYTFSFYYTGSQKLYLNDLKLQTSTLVSDNDTYLFTYEKGDEQRFIISTAPFNIPDISTGVGNTTNGENAKAVKFIKDDKIFIFVNGMLYDATGKMVIR